MGRSGGGHSGGGDSSGGFSGGGRSSGGFSGGGGHGRSGGGPSGGNRPGGFSHIPNIPRIPHIPSGLFGGRPPSPPPRPPRPNGPPRSGQEPEGCLNRTVGCLFSGCATTILLVVLMVAMLVMVLVSPTFEFANGGITPSSYARERLPASAVETTNYYTDTAGWINVAHKLEKGLKAFYKETGVQPYVYIMQGNASPTVRELTQHAEQLYDELFRDEGHFLLVFYDNEEAQNYTCGYTVGAEAKTVMDDEAIGILGDYLDRYYPSNRTEEEFFSDAFEKTGERIMTRTTSPLVPVAVCCVAIAAVIAVYLILKHRREQKEREEQQLQEILQTPLETFGDSEAEELAKKYEDK